MKINFRFLFVVFCLFASVNPSHAQWLQTNTGLTDTRVNALAVSGTNLFAGTDLGVFSSKNYGASWTDMISGYTDANVRTLAVFGTTLYGGTDNYLFVVSVNGGSVGGQYHGIRIYALAVFGSYLFAGTYQNGVFISNIKGETYAPANRGLTSSGCSVWAFAISDTNLFAGSIDFGVFRYPIDGPSWIAVNSGLTDSSVFTLAISGTNLFAGTFSGGVFLSTNNGTSWSAVNTGLTNTKVRALAVSGTNLFAGTDGGGVFLSTNNGTSWSAVSTGLTNTSITAFAVCGTNLFAGTSSGVWRRPLSEMITSVERLSTDLPTHFSLDQNYPNPFNPSTTISFSLPFKSFVSLKVYDALGREVSTLVSEELSAGTYSQRWSAADLPSGVYYYCFQTGSFTETKKLILLK